MVEEVAESVAMVAARVEVARAELAVVRAGQVRSSRMLERRTSRRCCRGRRLRWVAPHLTIGEVRRPSNEQAPLRLQLLRVLPLPPLEARRSVVGRAVGAGTTVARFEERAPILPSLTAGDLEVDER